MVLFVGDPLHVSSYHWKTLKSNKQYVKRREFGYTLSLLQAVCLRNKFALTRRYVWNLIQFSSFSHWTKQGQKCSSLKLRGTRANVLSNFRRITSMQCTRYDVLLILRFFYRGDAPHPLSVAIAIVHSWLIQTGVTGLMGVCMVCHSVFPVLQLRGHRHDAIRSIAHLE